MAGRTGAAQQQQLIKTLEDLLKLPENKECADCGTKAPRWASTNLGIFVCIRCSGIHRSMGTHISKVKSVSLDKWTPEQVDFMVSMGNAKSNEIFEADVSGHQKGDIRVDNISLENWIRDKYERKRFMRRNYDSHPSNNHPSAPPPSRSRANSSGATNNHHHTNNPRPQQSFAPSSHPSAPSHSSSSQPPASRPVAPKPPTHVTAAPPPQPAADLLNWDEPAPAPTHANTSSGDIFGDFVGSGGDHAATHAHSAVDKNSILQLYKTPLTPAGFHPGQPHGAHPPGYGGAPPGYPPQGYGAPPQGYPPQGYLPQGYGAPPQGYPPQGYPPQGYGAPPPGYGAPPPGYGAPPGGYGAPPGGYGAPPGGFGGAPNGYGAPAGVGYGAPPGPNYNVGAGLGVPGANLGAFNQPNPYGAPNPAMRPAVANTSSNALSSLSLF